VLSVKVPQGYSSKVKNLVSMDDLKLMGLKSHDCHVLMQDLLPVAIHGILPKYVRQVITRLCLFFNAICRKAIDPTRLDELENEAIIILCQLEMYFPSSFFDIMVHLIVHLVREIRLCGPVFLRWMYPIERCMKILMADSSKKTREATRMKAIAINHLGGVKFPVDVDPQAGRASGPNKAQFASYLGVLARTKVSILVPDWDHVTEAEKDLIWQDLCVSNSFKV